VQRAWVAVIFGLIIVSAGLSAYLVLNQAGDGGWEDIPRKVYDFDQYPGEEVVIRGRLEANSRIILALPEGGNPELITEDRVDEIVEEGLRESYDFRKPGWTHVILSDQDTVPSYQENGSSYYVLINSGSEAWKSEDVYSGYEGEEVEILGKWDSYTDPEYPGLGIVQFRGKSIRLVK